MELLAFQKVNGVVHQRVVGHEKVAVGTVGPVVPMAVHEVVVNHGVGLGQVGVTLLYGRL